jgi:hypothetical protein
MPKAPMPQPIPHRTDKSPAPAERDHRDDVARERQDERAFPNRDPAQKKTGEF